MWVLDSIAGFRKSMIVQEPDKLRDSQSYVWPCHKVLVVEDSLIKDEGEREALTQTQPSLLLSFQVQLFTSSVCVQKQMLTSICMIRVCGASPHGQCITCRSGIDQKDSDGKINVSNFESINRW